MRKVLEDANLKLASVATDILRQSGRAFLAALVNGEDDLERLAELSRGSLRGKIPILREALWGRITDHHGLLLERLLGHLRFLESDEAQVEWKTDERMSPFEAAVERWKSIPGVDRVTAWSLVGEIGTRMEQFPSARHLASWARVCLRQQRERGQAKIRQNSQGKPLVARVRRH